MDSLSDALAAGGGPRHRAITPATVCDHTPWLTEYQLAAYKRGEQVLCDNCSQLVKREADDA